MKVSLSPIKIGLLFVIFTLIFGICMGIGFGVNEEYFKDYIAQGIEMHSAPHDEKSQSKIWRYAQRSHFHATGIAAFSLGLLLLMLFSNMKRSMVRFASVLIGLGNLYPLSWFAMFLLAPEIGRKAAHEHVITQVIAYLSVGSLLIGLAIFCGGVFMGWCCDRHDD
jgi:nitrate reductase gamma subunit